jgi:flagellar basal body-associated protein FliL
MRKKILIPIAVLIVVCGGGFAAYSVAFAKKAPAPKINGTVVTLAKSFTMNLSDGQYATLSVALLLPKSEKTMTDEPVVRAIITDVITDQPSTSLLSANGRTEIQRDIVHDINTQTNLKVNAIYFTDLAVQ